jgi:HK97 family phage portal protein
MGWLRRLEQKGVTFTPANPEQYGVSSGIPYRVALRGVLEANVIMAPIMWIMRTFPEAEPAVERKMGSKPWRAVDDHALIDILRNPNSGYDGACLFQATVLSYLIDGNAYWIKRRNVFGAVLEYWYVPHWLIEPKWEGDDFISYYDYRPFNAPPERLAPSEVVHFRFALDPKNTRKGLSQIRTLMREVYTDEEASSFSSSILRNMGAPGVLVSPKGSDLPLQEDVEAVKKYLKEQFRGENRGEPLVFGAPTDVVQFGFDPNRLTLGNLRDIAEERVCAALGLPAAIVGFGSGLQSTKVGATMRELRRLAWVQCITPLQLSVSRQLTRETLPDFEPTLTWRWRVRFDTSGVSAFQEEETEKTKRVTAAVSAGIMRVDVAQEALGLEVDESQKVYLRPTAAMPVEEGDAGIPEDVAGGGDGDEGDDDPPPRGRADVLEAAALALAQVKARNGNHGGR